MIHSDKTMQEYTQISLKKEIAEKLDEIIAENGFTSRAEFIRFCIINELKNK